MPLATLPAWPCGSTVPSHCSSAREPAGSESRSFGHDERRGRSPDGEAIPVQQALAALAGRPGVGCLVPLVDQAARMAQRLLDAADKGTLSWNT